VRHWLKKHGLKTNSTLTALDNCQSCQKKLTSHQKLFCSSACKHATKKYRKRNYSSQQKRGWKRKTDLVNLMGGKCQQCGYDKNCAALHFHHIDPLTKEFGLDVRALSTLTLDACVVEANKCKLLCGNCHSEFHYPQFNKV
jgi:hypothetical protein